MTVRPKLAVGEEKFKRCFLYTCAQVLCATCNQWNPRVAEEETITWVQCDICDKWSHDDCVDWTRDQKDSLNVLTASLRGTRTMPEQPGNKVLAGELGRRNRVRLQGDQRGRKRHRSELRPEMR